MVNWREIREREKCYRVYPNWAPYPGSDCNQIETARHWETKTSKKALLLLHILSNTLHSPCYAVYLQIYTKVVAFCPKKHSSIVQTVLGPSAAQTCLVLRVNVEKWELEPIGWTCFSVPAKAGNILSTLVLSQEERKVGIFRGLWSRMQQKA